MIKKTYFSLGWIPPSDEKRVHNLCYPISLAKLPEPPPKFEKELPVPWQYRAVCYDQGDHPACVGFSGAWHMSTNFNIHGNTKLFSGLWLYNKACEISGCDPAYGTFMWAGADVLRKFGLVEYVPVVLPEPFIGNGIKSYVWALSWMDVRAAIWNNQPVWFGLPWYDSFFEPLNINGDLWIGRGKKLGTLAGGHAIFGFEWSDNRDACAITSTWGERYPKKVWMHKELIQQFLGGGGGECALTLDRIVTPIPVVPKPKYDIWARIRHKWF